MTAMDLEYEEETMGSKRQIVRNMGWYNIWTFEKPTQQSNYGSALGGGDQKTKSGKDPRLTRIRPTNTSFPLALDYRTYFWMISLHVTTVACPVESHGWRVRSTYKLTLSPLIQMTPLQYFPFYRRFKRHAIPTESINVRRCGSSSTS